MPNPETRKATGAATPMAFDEPTQAMKGSKMNMIAISGDFNGPVTMSSREIAELCEKRHDHVLRDIEKMLADIADPKFGASDFASTYKDSTGRSLKEYHLPKDLTVTLITGYRADLRYKVVKRLEELEGSGGSPALLTGPQLMAAALIEANATLAQKDQEIEAMKPAVAALDRLEASEGAVAPRVAAKVLNIQEKALFRWMHANGWCFRQGKTWQGYSEKIKQGYLEHEVFSYTVSETGEDRARIQMKITPKGLARLAQIFTKEGGIV